MGPAPGQGCPVPVPFSETKETGLKANGNYMPIGRGIIVARPTPAKSRRPPCVRRATWATGHESGTTMLLERGSQPAREFVLDQVEQARPEVIEVTDQILGQLRELAASRVLAADLGVDQGCA